VKAHELARLLLAEADREVIVQHDGCYNAIPTRVQPGRVCVDEEAVEEAWEEEEEADYAFEDCVLICIDTDDRNLEGGTDAFLS
jgi:hypothetical protein